MQTFYWTKGKWWPQKGSGKTGSMIQKKPSVAYQKETRTVSFQEKTIVQENLMPIRNVQGLLENPN